MTAIKPPLSVSSIETGKNKVLIAPLNWGLGHASRCIPIIHFLLDNKCTPVIASDGLALSLLQKEFPELETIQLPSYNIRYSKFNFWTKWRLLFSVFSVIRAVKEERAVVDKIIDVSYIGVISDNRFGVISKRVPSVFITHQLQVFSGFTSLFTSKIHQKIISKFDVCWVPDVKGFGALSGSLSNPDGVNIPINYLGNLSRLALEERKKKFDIVLLISGIEPQRSVLESIFFKEFFGFEGSVLLVRGVVEEKIKREEVSGIEVVNFLTTKLLQDTINASDLVVARSGYSTIMDLAKLRKKAFFIPTPGQSEQEYLAEYMKQKKIAPFCKQEQFSIAEIVKVKDYLGFQEDCITNLKTELLDLFKRI